MPARIRLVTGEDALVDDEDLPLVERLRWSRSNGYAQHSRWEKGVCVYRTMMHRLILPPPVGLVIDHIDGNRLNNQRSNLRLASQQQNSWNRRPRGGLRFRGVAKTYRGFRAAIYESGRQVQLGLYSTAEDAARAYDAAALELHGEFARLNFPAFAPAQAERA